MAVDKYAYKNLFVGEFVTVEEIQYRRGTRYSIAFGDSGYERDPGVYMEYLDDAIAQLTNQMAEARRALEILLKEARGE